MRVSVNHDFERRVGLWPAGFDAAGERRVGALIKGRKYWVRVDAFNGNGITEGNCVPLEGEEQA